MDNSIIAKNLLLGNNCWNCQNAASLISRKDIKASSFEEMTGSSIETIHEGAFIDDTLFYCWHKNQVLPKELFCNGWEKERE